MARPGRVNLIGEHTAYNGGFALPFANGQTCTATVQRGDDQQVTVRSAQRPVSAPLTDLSAPEPGWAQYPLGVVWALQKRGTDLPGLRIELDSAVPLGAGSSSSAAVVCSVATALDELLELGLSGDELLAVTCRAENEFVGEFATRDWQPIMRDGIPYWLPRPWLTPDRKPIRKHRPPTRCPESAWRR